MMAAGRITYRDVVLSDGPYAYYRLEQIAGAVATDETPARRDAVWQGEIQPSQPGLVRGSVAAAQFGDAAGYLDVPFGLDPAASTATFEIWLRPAATLPSSGRQTLLAQRDGTGVGRSWLYIDDAGQDGFGAHNLNTLLGGVPISTGEVITAATRYHIVLEVTPGAWQLYVNGQAKQGGSVTSEAASGAFVVGLNKSLSGDPFQGIAAAIAFYTHTLGSARVQAHYEAGG
jgi:hypothetical protein